MGNTETTEVQKKSAGSQSLPIHFHSIHDTDDDNNNALIRTPPAKRSTNRITSSSQIKMPIPKMMSAYSPSLTNSYTSSANSPMSPKLFNYNQPQLNKSRVSQKTLSKSEANMNDDHHRKHKKKGNKNKLPANLPSTNIKSHMSHDTSQKKWSKNLQKAISVTESKNIISDISKLFYYRRRLAKGSSCCVLLCQHKKTKKLYALKEMNKHSVWNPLLYITERKILKKLKSHTNIMHYYDSYIDNKCLYIASEYCCGGTLLDKIIKMNKFTEKIAAKYITTILNVVDFIHQQNICHRDLKPNNIVFDKPGYVINNVFVCDLIISIDLTQLSVIQYISLLDMHSFSLTPFNLSVLSDILSTTLQHYEPSNF